MYKSILVPLDGSELAECSLQHAIAIARGCQAPDITLLTVIKLSQKVYPMEPTSATYLEKEIREQEQFQNHAIDEAKEYLTRLSKKLSNQNISPRTVIIQTTLSQGVADMILDYVKKNGIDLIIMSTHGRSGITRWAMGSIADRVVRGSLVPVLTITPTGCRL